MMATAVRQRVVVIYAARSIAYVSYNKRMEIDNKYKSTVRNPTNKPIREHSAEIVSGGNVFYNPVQEFNRDLSVAVLNVYFKRLVKERQVKEKNASAKKNDNPSEDTNAMVDITSDEKVKEYVAGQQYSDGMRILEALSATGLRSIRYAKEVAGVREIIANDLSIKAVESISENVKHNKVEDIIKPNHADATTLMYLSNSEGKRFDAIDLDPYGCPNRFLDGAVQSLVDGGLLLVTATDMAVLAGNAPEACFVKYGSVSLRIRSCHEMALRILLHCVEAHANRYGKYIEPLLSISADFYVRIFVRIHASQAKCKFSMSKQSMIYQCTGCDTYTLQPLGTLKANPTETNPNQMKFGIPTGPTVGTNCMHCGNKHHMGGPIWSHPIHDETFVQDLLEEIQREPLSNLGTQKRLLGVLSVVSEELNDIPLYYTLDKLCSILKLESVPMLKFRSALLHAGYRVSFSHAYKNSIKTNAPAEVLWNILRCWNRRHPVKAERMLDGTPVKAILGKECGDEFNFDELHPLANPISRKKSLTRFQANPTAHWGPGTRATIMVGEDKIAKSFRNQNKKQKQKLNAGSIESFENDVLKSKQIKLDEDIK